MPRRSQTAANNEAIEVVINKLEEIVQDTGPPNTSDVQHRTSRSPCKNLSLNNQGISSRVQSCAGVTVADVCSHKLLTVVHTPLF